MEFYRKYQKNNEYFENVTSKYYREHKLKIKHIYDLVSSDIVLDTKTISESKIFPIKFSSKNLIKLYMNDVGIFTNVLYKHNINAILMDKKQINLGAVYETIAAQELITHGHKLYYYDRRKIGEVDYLIDDYNNLSVLPIEIKSGSDENNFRALPKLINDINYNIQKAYVFNNKREIKNDRKIIFMPIYFIMFV